MLTHFCSLLNSWPFRLPDECEWQYFDMSAKRVCGNCIHFIGLGDWGLGCKKHYYKLPKRVTDSTKCEDYEVADRNEVAE